MASEPKYLMNELKKLSGALRVINMCHQRVVSWVNGGLEFVEEGLAFQTQLLNHYTERHQSFIQKYVYIHVHIYVHSHVPIQHINVHITLHIHAHIPVYIHAHRHLNIHLHIHVHMHTNVHTSL